MFSCEFCKTSKNTFSYRTPPVAACLLMAPFHYVILNFVPLLKKEFFSQSFQSCNIFLKTVSCVKNETEGVSKMRVFIREISSQDESRPGMKSSLSMVKCLLLS